MYLIRPVWALTEVMWVKSWDCKLLRPWVSCVCVCVCVCVCARAQSLSRDPMDWSLPGSSVHGSSQGSLLEWIAISFYRDSSQLRDWTCVSCIGRWVLYHWAPREVLCYLLLYSLQWKLPKGKDLGSFFNIYYFLIYFIYLAAPGLSCGLRIFNCGMPALSFGMWDLVPQLGIEPEPPALGAQNLSQLTTREVPRPWFFNSLSSFQPLQHCLAHNW